MAFNRDFLKASNELPLKALYTTPQSQSNWNYISTVLLQLFSWWRTSILRKLNLTKCTKFHYFDYNQLSFRCWFYTNYKPPNSAHPSQWCFKHHVLAYFAFISFYLFHVSFKPIVIVMLLSSHSLNLQCIVSALCSIMLYLLIVLTTAYLGLC